jgi:DNA helicase MCM9
VSLFERSSLLGDGLLSSPEEHLVHCDIALREAQAQLLLAQPLEVQPLLSVKSKIHTRITGEYSHCYFCFIVIFCDIIALPSCPELHRTVFPKNEDTGSFLRVTGTVVRTSSPKMLEYQRIFRCRKCKHDNIAKVKFNM